MNLFFTPAAISDLTRLKAFVATKNPLAAQKMAEHLLSRIDNLCQFPDMGLPVERAADNTVRNLIAKPYIVRYALHNDTVAVLRIWHEKEQRSIL